jgi:hypothetical protein
MPSISSGRPPRVAHLPVLKGRALKIIVPSEPTEIASLVTPEGQSRTELQIKVGGRSVFANIATKSLRKAIATIRETGTGGCVVLLQGKLGPNDVVQECGLMAQVKAVKAA